MMATKIKFIDHNNGHFTDHKVVEIKGKVTKKELTDTQYKQPGVMRVGGSFQFLLRTLGYEWVEVDKNSNADIQFELIDGNY